MLYSLLVIPGKIIYLSLHLHTSNHLSEHIANLYKICVLILSIEINFLLVQQILLYVYGAFLPMVIRWMLPRH